MNHRRNRITEHVRRERNIQIIADYERLDSNGKFVLSIKALAEKYGVSVPMIYKILAERDKKLSY
jgi:Mor family transcriptional regulator